MAYKRVDYERQLIRWFARDKKVLIKYRLVVSPDMMSSSARSRILRTVIRFYELNSAKLSKRFVVSKDLLLSELERQKAVAEDNEEPMKKREWRLIKIEVEEIFSYTSIEEVSMLIDKLNDEIQREKVIDVVLQAGEQAHAGSIETAEKLLREYAFGNGVFTRTDKPIISITDINETESEMVYKREHPDMYNSISTGIPSIDGFVQNGKRKGGEGLFRNELVAVVAATNQGKSTFTKNIGLGVVTNNHNVGVLHITTEELPPQVKYKYQAMMAKEKYRTFKRPKGVGFAVTKRMRRFVKESFLFEENNVHIKYIPGGSTVGDVKRAYEMLKEQGVTNIGVVIIDYSEKMGPEVVKKYRDWEDEAQVYSDFNNFIKDNNLCGVIVSQASSESKYCKEVWDANVMMVSGSKRKAWEVDLLYFLRSFECDYDVTEVSEVDGEPVETKRSEEDDLTRVTCMNLKNRDLPTFFFKLDLNKQTGEMQEVPGLFEQFNWRRAKKKGKD